MNANWWSWLWLNDGGLITRAVIGGAILLALLIVDLVRHGKTSRRLREYAFLLVATAVIMLFAVVTDMITVTISPMYFLTHEHVDLAQDWSDNVRTLAAWVAIKASWTGGLVLGVAMLLANNPSRRFRQLPAGGMYLRMGYPLILGCLIAAAMGALAYYYIEEGTVLPGFTTVLYAHWGAYAGAALGGALAVVSVIRRRRRLPAKGSEASPGV